MKYFFTFFAILFFSTNFLITKTFAAYLPAKKNPPVDYYLVKVYHCTDMQQIKSIEAYVATDLIPFLHKNAIRDIGVFLPMNIDTALDKKLFVWVPFNRLDQLALVESKLDQLDPMDITSLSNLDTVKQQLPFTRMETMLASAFKFHSRYQPATDFSKTPEAIYEFRSYESKTQNLHLRKVHMFNEGGEIELFKRLNFNALFYGRVIVGAHMPNLIYMTRFKNLEDRNTHWKAFGADPVWKRLNTLPEYAGTVSKNETILMKAAECSEL